MSIESFSQCLNAGIQVRKVNFGRLTRGILHTKFWIVDRRHIYIGSANMDWRALTQVKIKETFACHVSSMCDVYLWCLSWRWRNWVLWFITPAVWLPTCTKSSSRTGRWVEPTLPSPTRGRPATTPSLMKSARWWPTSAVCAVKFTSRWFDFIITAQRKVL